MSAPFVSIIVPFYNNESYAARAIESVLQQTFQDYELLLVDNNSTDGTLQILRDYQAKYPDRIRVFQETKQGCPAARNRGLREARGEWIQVLDSDDELVPEKLEHELPLTKLQDVGVIICSTCKYRVVNDTVHKKVKHPDTGDPWRSLLLFRLGSTNACLWRKKDLLAVNGWNENWSSVEDYELYFRVLKNGIKMAFSPYVDSIVHMRANSMSRSLDYKIFTRHVEHAIRIRRMVRDHMRSTGRLTKSLEREFEIGLYFKLLNWRRHAPDFIDEQFKELKLTIPARIKIKQVVKDLKHRTAKKVKQVFHFSQ